MINYVFARNTHTAWYWRWFIGLRIHFIYKKGEYAYATVSWWSHRCHKMWWLDGRQALDIGA